MVDVEMVGPQFGNSRLQTRGIYVNFLKFYKTKRNWDGTSYYNLKPAALFLVRDTLSSFFFLFLLYWIMGSKKTGVSLF